MPRDPQPVHPLFHIDVTPETAVPSADLRPDKLDAVLLLLRHMLEAQQRQNKLLEELVQQAGALQRQRATELNHWRQANPELSRRCRRAAEALSRVQNEFLQRLTEEVMDGEECLLEGDFMLHEFVDRFGPRLAHLNGVLQVLSQLSYPGEATADPTT